MNSDRCVENKMVDMSGARLAGRKQNQGKILNSNRFIENKMMETWAGPDRKENGGKLLYSDWYVEYKMADMGGA